MNRTLAICLLAVFRVSFGFAEEPRVSFHEQIRPLFQAHCQGCHQPAKAGGKYVMTAFDKLLAGGDSGTAITPGKPDESYLLETITPNAKGEAEMPKGKPALAASDVALIRRWIEQGAVDDSPPRIRFDAANPPVYTSPPVVTSLDFSPDGKRLAIAGNYEVLLHKVDGSESAVRLVGGAERIESVRFSPDGKRLAVAGGMPGVSGELQIWEVESRKLLRSHAVTYDVLYGASWSPDGKRIAFGCGDKSVRAIDAATGEQVLYQSTHEDRAVDTVFSQHGDHVISVSADRTAKLTELATQRFIDNITSITPGALKGGINSVARHPNADVILVGGADGEPKLYRVFRQTKRVIGDDANLIRRFPPLSGRVNGVAISRDGRRAAAVSSLDGTGHVRVYAFEFETNLPPELAAISQKEMAQRTNEDRKKLEDYFSKSVKPLAEVHIPDSGLYAVAFRPESSELAVAGADGKVRLIHGDTGAIVREFAPVTVQPQMAMAGRKLGVRKAAAIETESERKALPPLETLTALEVLPARATLDRPYDTVQFLVTGRFASGDVADVTRIATVASSADVVHVSPTRLVSAKADGNVELTFSLGNRSATASLTVTGVAGEFRPNYVRDVAPVIAKLGCNSGTCHGANKGKGGFKISLRGNDPVFDVRAFTDELACRRVNFAAPDNSLLLAKASANVPHEAGRITGPGETYYELLRGWIVGGAKLDSATPRVTGIEIFPRDPIVQQIDSRQQFRVVATYADGTTRDVTPEAFIESGNAEVTKVDATGLATTLRRGEAPVLARFEGSYAATTLTVMGDRTGVVWQDPPVRNFVDELVAAKWKRTKTAPSDLCSDAEFLRRVQLDLTGLPPTADEVRKFLADGRESQVKRDELIDRLIGSSDYVEHWTNKWADLLQVNRKYLGVEGATAFRGWIREQIAANTPYDKFAASVLTASGSNREHPAAAFYKIHRTPDDAMETTTHLFLAIRFNCNKCHDHPFERWTQDQYYETAAFFARVGLKKDAASGDRKVEGTAVEGATPLFEEVFDKPDGEVKHDRSGAVTLPKVPYGKSESRTGTSEPQPRRLELAAWLASADNRYFARSYVNRMWAYLLGVGLIEPLDDIRAGNPPSNAELLDRLTQEFVASGFNVQHLLRTICQSRTYQLSIATNRWNDDDRINYSHAFARRLPAEVLYDSLTRVTGTTQLAPGVARGTRAAQFLDPAVGPPGGFLTLFGRPPRESPCECERSTGMQFGPVMAMVSGQVVGDAISDPANELAKLAASQPDDRRLIDELFLRILNRPASESEIVRLSGSFSQLPKDHEKLVADLKAAEASQTSVAAEREKQRQAAIEQATAELAAYEKSIASREADLDRQQRERTAKLEVALQEYVASLPAKLAAWEARGDRLPKWVVLDASDLSATSATTLTKQPDLSVLATVSNGIGAYKFVAPTDLTGITAIRLEAIVDDRQPKKGPGRAPDGNLVLTEFEVQAAPKSDPAKVTKVGLTNAQADFSQKDYPVSSAIDGVLAPARNGWAISPQMGVNHQAAFEAQSPVGFEGGTVLTIVLHQQFQSGEHTLGRFRLSVTTSAAPILLNELPEAVAKALAVAADQRTDEQRKTLLDFVQNNDAEHKRHVAAIEASRQPRPVDPKLQSLRDKLAAANRPVSIDPRLQQLRDDVALSAKQLENQRLTAVQDIAWALINSPAFLFNR